MDTRQVEWALLKSADKHEGETWQRPPPRCCRRDGQGRDFRPTFCKEKLGLSFHGRVVVLWHVPDGPGHWANGGFYLKRPDLSLRSPVAGSGTECSIRSRPFSAAAS